VKKIRSRAIQAGADILLYCNEPASPPLALEALQESLDKKELTAEKVAEVHDRIAAHKKTHLANPDPVDKKTLASIIGSPEHFKLAQDISAS